MANVDKTFNFLKEEENLYNIDNYKIHSTTKSVELDFNGRVKLKNYNPKRNTSNFYGNASLGNYNKMNNDNIAPLSVYFTEITNDKIYGHCLHDVWFNESNADFKPGDEVILYKKHVEKEEYIDELGQWELVTIKEKIVEDTMVHYAIEAPTELDFTTKTANSCTLILQYNRLELFDDIKMNLVKPSVSYISIDNSKIWNNRTISYPDGIIFIKAQDQIILGKNSSIGSYYGNSGAQYYDGNYYAHGGSPLGCGTSSVNGNTIDEEIFDTRTNGFKPIGDNTKFYSSAGMGHYGTHHGEQDSNIGRPHPISEDLNENIYTGVGCQQHSYSSSSYNYLGSTGGGIVIIQTPKITFKDEKSSIVALSSNVGSNYGYGFGSGGSILLKAAEIIIKNSPQQLALFDADYPTQEEIDGTATDADGNALPKRAKEQELSIFRTMNQYIMTAEQKTSVMNDCISAPGQIQLEFDTMTIEDTTYAKDDVTEDMLKDIIVDYRSCNVLSNIRSINTVESWDFIDNQISFLHSYYAPLYEINNFFKFYTSGMKNINIEGWYDLLKISNSFVTPEGTEIKLAFSIDSGSSWKYINLDGSEPEISSIAIDTEFDSKGNTVQELEDYTDQTILTQGFILPQRAKENKFIDLCIALKTTKESTTPLFDFLYLNYEKAPVLKAPIPINPFNGEEFNNEFVDFIWLQPYQKYGSIQNRLEINTVPSFERDEKLLSIDDEDNSSSSGRVMLPYKPSIYDNKISNLRYFKLPYIKNRIKPIENSYDYDRHSFEYDYENNLIKYQGGDEFFFKGQTIRLQPQEDLNTPSTLDFKLDISGDLPSKSSLITYMDLTGTTDLSTIEDQVSPDIWNFVKVGNALNTTTDTAHLYAPKFYKSSESYITLDMKNTSISTLTWLDRTKEATIYCRFTPGDIELDDYNVLFDIFNYSLNKSWAKVRLVKSKDHNNNYYYSLFYNNGYNNYNTYVEHLHKDLEYVVCLQYSTDNTVNIYLNGVKIYKDVKAVYYDTASEHYLDETKNKLDLTLGNYHSPNNDESFIGRIKEFAIWQEKLSKDQIVEISKVPNYNLLYNIETNKMEFFRTPYKFHLDDYQYVRDEVEYFDNYTNKWNINDSNFSSAMSEPYYNNNRYILIGTYSPAEHFKDNFHEHYQNHKPISGIPFLLNRNGNPTNTYNDMIKYSDNNSLKLNNNTDNSGVFLIDHQRIKSSSDSVELNFFYREQPESKRNSQHIGIVTGALSSGEAVELTYSRYVYIKKFKTSEFRLGFYVRHTNNHVYNVINADTDNQYSNLPFPLIKDNSYKLKFIVPDGFSSFSIWLYSNSDENYKQGIKLWDHKIANSYTPASYGYTTANFNDLVTSINYEYEEIAINLGAGPEPEFEVIDLSVSDDTSELLQEPGYLDRYDMLLFITPDYLKKLNFIDIKSNSENALTDIRFFISFNQGLTWVVYDKENSNWIDVDITDYSNGMNISDTMSLTTYNFEKSNGFELGKSFTLRSVLITNDSRSTPYLENIKISYNGPIIIDSWDESGSYYNGSTFYYNDDGSWNPYIEPNFVDESQAWKEHGSGIPNSLNFIENKGSKPSTSDNKVFSGTRILLNPKGKYYWRVAAYNGE